jgi:hypothetical protein
MLDDLRRPAEGLFNPVLALASAVVAGIEPDLVQARELRRDGIRQQELDPSAVHAGGRMDADSEDQAVRVDQQMARAALDLFALLPPS